MGRRSRSVGRTRGSSRSRSLWLIIALVAVAGTAASVFVPTLVRAQALSAATAAEKVKRTGAPFRFNPMNSRERRVIHLALRNETEVRSESSGHGGFRQVIIYPCFLAGAFPQATLGRGLGQRRDHRRGTNPGFP